MTREDAIARLKQIEPQARALGVTALYLFGSTARGEAGPDSDLDVFVEYRPGFSGFDLMGVKHIIEDEIGVSADVLTRTGLHPLLRPRIEASAVKVF